MRRVALILTLCFFLICVNSVEIRQGMSYSGGDLVGVETYKYGRLEVTFIAPTCSGARVSIALEGTSTTFSTSVEMSVQMQSSQISIFMAGYGAGGSQTSDSLYSPTATIPGKEITIGIEWTPSDIGFTLGGTVLKRRNFNTDARYNDFLFPVSRFNVASSIRVAVLGIEDSGSVGLITAKCLPVVTTVRSVTWYDYATTYVQRWKDTLGTLDPTRWKLSPRYFPEIKSISLSDNVIVGGAGNLQLVLTAVDYHRSGNGLRNPLLESGTDWSLDVESPGRATMKASSTCYYSVNIVNVGTLSTHIKLSQQNIELKAGRGYELRIAASSTLVRAVTFSVYSSSSTSSSSFSFGDKGVRLSPFMTEFVIPFVWGSVDTQLGIVSIAMGRHDEVLQPHTVDFMYINMTKIAAVNMSVVPPTSAAVSILGDPGFLNGVGDSVSWKLLSFDGASCTTKYIAGVGLRVDITNVAATPQLWHLQITQDVTLKKGYVYNLYVKGQNYGTSDRTIVVSIVSSQSSTTTDSGEHYLVMTTTSTAELNITFVSTLTVSSRLSLQFGLSSMTLNPFALQTVSLIEVVDSTLVNTTLSYDIFSNFTEKISRCVRRPRISGLLMAECAGPSLELKGCFASSRTGSGMELTIIGQGWEYQSNPQLIVTLNTNGPSCTPITFVNDTCIICVLGTSSSVGPWLVRVTDASSGNYSSENAYVTFAQPKILSVESPSCTQLTAISTGFSYGSCQPNSTILLKGSSFDTVLSGNVVTFTGQTTPPTGSVTSVVQDPTNATLFTATVNVGVVRGGTWTMSLTVRGQLALGVVVLVFAQPPPVLTEFRMASCATSISVLQLTACTGGSLVIIGQYFDNSGTVTQSVFVVPENSAPTTQTATCTNVRSLSSTMMLCDLFLPQAASPLKYNIRVAVGTLTSAQVGSVTTLPIVSFSATLTSMAFLPPCVTSVATASGATIQTQACSQGVLIIQGSFPSADVPPFVSLTPTGPSCSVLNYNASTITCYLQAGSDSTYDVAIVIRSTSSTNTGKLQIQLSPVVSDVPIVTILQAPRCIGQPKPTELTGCAPVGAITMRGIAFPSSGVSQVLLTNGQRISRCNNAISNSSHIICTPDYTEISSISLGPWTISLVIGSNTIQTTAVLSLDLLPVVTDIDMPTCIIHSRLFLQGCSSGSLTIIGSNFGDDFKVAEVQLQVSGSLSLCPITSFSKTRIECQLTLPSIVDLVTVTVRINSQSSGNSIAKISPLQLAPEVSALSLSSCLSISINTAQILCGNGVLTIYGKNFDTTNPQRNVVSFTSISPSPTCTTIGSDDIKLTCSLSLTPTLVGQGFVRVQVLNLTSLTTDAAAVTAPPRPTLLSAVLTSLDTLQVQGSGWDPTALQDIKLHILSDRNCTITCTYLVWSATQANCTLSMVGSECITNTSIYVSNRGRLSDAKWIFFQGVYTKVISTEPKTPLMIFTTGKYSPNAFPVLQLQQQVAISLTSILLILSENNVQIYSVCQESSTPSVARKNTCVNYDNEYFPTTKKLELQHRSLLNNGDTLVGFKVRHSLLQSSETLNAVLSSLNNTFSDARQKKGILSWVAPTSSLTYVYSVWPAVNPNEVGGVVIRVGLLGRHTAIPMWTWMLLVAAILFLVAVTAWVLRRQLRVIEHHQTSVTKLKRKVSNMERRYSAAVATMFTIHVTDPEEQINDWLIWVEGTGVVPGDVTAKLTPLDILDEQCGDYQVRLNDVTFVVHFKLVHKKHGKPPRAYAVQPTNSLEVWVSTASSRVRYTDRFEDERRTSNGEININMSAPNSTRRVREDSDTSGVLSEVLPPGPSSSLPTKGSDDIFGDSPNQRHSEPKTHLPNLKVVIPDPDGSLPLNSNVNNNATGGWSAPSKPILPETPMRAVSVNGPPAKKENPLDFLDMDDE